MKQYQARTKDLKTVLKVFDGSETLSQMHMACSFRSIRCVLVLAEWETEEEADKARLDHLEQSGVMDRYQVVKDGCAVNGSLRDKIDAARNAPQPTVTIINP